MLEDQNAGASQRQGSPEPGNTIDEKARICLICRSEFPSEWAGERICRRCKATSVWRNGALK